MICKRAERIYSNSYSVFTLYCNRCSKREPSYVATKKSYNKRSTNCPFLLKFTRKGYKNCEYELLLYKLSFKFVTINIV